MKDAITVTIKPVADLPRDLWIAQLGDNRDAPCGTGSTVPEALEELASRLRRDGLQFVEHYLPRLMRGEIVANIVKETPA